MIFFGGVLKCTKNRLIVYKYFINVKKRIVYFFKMLVVSCFVLKKGVLMIWF